MAESVQHRFMFEIFLQSARMASFKTTYNFPVKALNCSIITFVYQEPCNLPDWSRVPLSADCYPPEYQDCENLVDFGYRYCPKYTCPKNVNPETALPTTTQPPKLPELPSLPTLPKRPKSRPKWRESSSTPGPFWRSGLSVNFGRSRPATRWEEVNSVAKESSGRRRQKLSKNTGRGSRRKSRKGLSRRKQQRKDKSTSVVTSVSESGPREVSEVSLSNSGPLPKLNRVNAPKPGTASEPQLSESVFSSDHLPKLSVSSSSSLPTEPNVIKSKVNVPKLTVSSSSALPTESSVIKPKVNVFNSDHLPKLNASNSSSLPAESSVIKPKENVFNSDKLLKLNTSNSSSLPTESSVIKPKVNVFNSGHLPSLNVSSSGSLPAKSSVIKPKTKLNVIKPKVNVFNSDYLPSLNVSSSSSLPAETSVIKPKVNVFNSDHLPSLNVSSSSSLPQPEPNAPKPKTVPKLKNQSSVNKGVIIVSRARPKEVEPDADAVIIVLPAEASPRHPEVVVSPPSLKTVTRNIFSQVPRSDILAKTDTESATSSFSTSESATSSFSTSTGGVYSNATKSEFSALSPAPNLTVSTTKSASNKISVAESVSNKPSTELSATKAVKIPPTPRSRARHDKTTLVIDHPSDKAFVFTMKPRNSAKSRPEQVPTALPRSRPQKTFAKCLLALGLAVLNSTFGNATDPFICKNGAKCYTQISFQHHCKTYLETKGPDCDAPCNLKGCQFIYQRDVTCTQYVCTNPPPPSPKPEPTSSLLWMWVSLFLLISSISGVGAGVFFWWRTRQVRSLLARVQDDVEARHLVDPQNWQPSVGGTFSPEMRDRSPTPANLGESPGRHATVNPGALRLNLRV